MASVAQELLWEQQLQAGVHSDRRDARRSVSADSITGGFSDEARQAQPRSVISALRDRGSGASLVDRAAGLSSLTGNVSAAMQKSYAALWEIAEDIFENGSLAFFGLGSLFLGIPAVLIFIVRLGATFMKGYGQVQWRGISVPRVSPLSFPTSIIHASKIVVIALTTGILFSFLGLVAYLAANPDEAIRLGLCVQTGLLCPTTSE